MPHPNAEILRAIADGKQVQWQNTAYTLYSHWHDLNTENNEINNVNALQCLIEGSPHLQWRVKPEKKTGWVNIYHSQTIKSAVIWDTKEAADKNADTLGRIACIQITYEEGEGL